MVEWKYYDDDGSLNKTLIYNKEGLKIDSIGHIKNEKIFYLH